MCMMGVVFGIHHLFFFLLCRLWTSLVCLFVCLFVYVAIKC